jgi:hypothetical protein
MASFEMAVALQDLGMELRTTGVFKMPEPMLLSNDMAAPHYSCDEGHGDYGCT